MNLVAAWLLSSAASHNLSVRGALLHVLSDLLGSVGVIASGIVILVTGWNAADAVASMIIAVLILVSSFGLIREAVDVLMEAVPRHIDLDELRRTLEGVPGRDRGARSARLEPHDRALRALGACRRRGGRHRRSRSGGDERSTRRAFRHPPRDDSAGGEESASRRAGALMHPAATLFLDVCVQRRPLAGRCLAARERGAGPSTSLACSRSRATLEVRQGGIVCRHVSAGRRAGRRCADALSERRSRAASVRRSACRCSRCRYGRQRRQRSGEALDRAHAIYVDSGCGQAPDDASRVTPVPSSISRPVFGMRSCSAPGSSTGSIAPSTRCCDAASALTSCSMPSAPPTRSLPR